MHQVAGSFSGLIPSGDIRTHGSLMSGTRPDGSGRFISPRPQEAGDLSGRYDEHHHQSVTPEKGLRT